MATTSRMRRFVKESSLYAPHDAPVKNENGKAVAGWGESES